MYAGRAKWTVLKNANEPTSSEDASNGGLIELTFVYQDDSSVLNQQWRTQGAATVYYTIGAQSCQRPNITNVGQTPYRFGTLRFY